MSGAIEFIESVLCDQCSNCGPGVKANGKRLCLSCVSDDVDLVAEVVRLARPRGLEQ